MVKEAGRWYTGENRTRLRQRLKKAAGLSGRAGGAGRKEEQDESSDV